ncbi:unnamed protein product [Didymodactylos carnosus]|uniref:GOST seven transmembrane domain-containing protein n=1 Tax=Didymodactylos carnosus TaxID=1234261 RepID=A0A813SJ29_9BILA|nr:unnamed protein product [Didymodactylos carnosus]CAF0946572.1 unnamed protein product [Didymodactylos carnosus]CAF3582518.1 unnamed protein product [Didymodactylos carnosus]CAF3721151.1 unnamed protein product [Didymodactylos carnosus]
MHLIFSLFVLLYTLLPFCSCALTNGIVPVQWHDQQRPILDRILYANTKINFRVICRTPTMNDTNAIIHGKKKPAKSIDQDYPDLNIEIRGRIGRVVSCLPLTPEFSLTSSGPSNADTDAQVEDKRYKNVWDKMQVKDFTIVQKGCDPDGRTVQLTQAANYTEPAILEQTSPPKEKKSETEKKSKEQPSNRRRRAANGTPLEVAVSKIDVNTLVTWGDGFYIIDFDQPTLKSTGDRNPDIDLIVSMKSKHGYLSGKRELLKIQFWIGGVILIGMFEKSAFLAEYDTTNRYGYTMKYAVITAEILSCLKRTVSRMLVVIVALGFGIVKPRLGPLKQKVIGMALLYFAIAATESFLRLYSKHDETSKNVLISRIPLAVVDATIYYWIFTGLVRTTRTLRVRKNVVKLNVYRHFTNTILFAIVASILFMIWSLKSHQFAKCITDWREFWVDDAFWHILFSLLLLVIMILFRPSNNNQRYAFVPLLDDEQDHDPDDMDDLDEEKGEATLFETVKLRGKQQENGTQVSSGKMNKKQQQNAERNLNVKEDKSIQGQNGIDDELTWVEDNIPTSIADQALQALDSEDEIVNTKLERSKMQ